VATKKQRTPYEVLGVAKDATLKDIKTAYRKRISDAHPDREGGDEDLAAEINAAYEVLSDPERRQRFDSSGSTDVPRNPRDLAEQGVIVLLMSVLTDERDFHGNIIDHLRERVKANTKGVNERIKKAREKIARLERLAGRLKGPMVEQLVENQLESARVVIVQAESQLETDRLVMELLGEYSDNWEKVSGSLGIDRGALPAGQVEALAAMAQLQGQSGKGWGKGF
jgi:curved DNA-binding protein CbpA